MIVTRAAVLGRCMGVRRAVDLALKAAAGEAKAGGRGRRVFTLGPLIHNPQTVALLESKGIHALGEGDIDGRVAGTVVVIRAHGVPPRMREALETAGADVMDATCPRVLASQRRARDYAARGWTVVIAGDRDHGEVTGIAGFAPGAVIVGSAEEAARIEADGPVALIAQTTIKEEEYRDIREALAGRFPMIEVVDSICPATAERLAALAELAKRCDALIVVGGRNSANTTRLYATAVSLGLPAWLVEGPDELPNGMWRFKRVGLTAGASTPDEAIDAVETALLAAAGGGQKPQGETR
jgi:4-hydroxy-3-methylbut-2-enyl diphosphate reductase